MNLKTVRVRAAKVEDAAAMAHFSAQLDHDEGNAPQNPVAVWKGLLSAWGKHGSMSRGTILVAEMRGVPVGCCAVFLDPKESPSIETDGREYYEPWPINQGTPEFEISNVWVEPKHRGNHIGERLVEAAIDWIERRETGSRWPKPVTLMVASDNKVALNLYQKLGFVAQPARDRDDHHYIRLGLEL